MANTTLHPPSPDITAKNRGIRVSDCSELHNYQKIQDLEISIVLTGLIHLPSAGHGRSEIHLNRTLEESAQ